MEIERSYSVPDLVITQEGNIPVILTSPHGGKLPLGKVHIRKSPGCCLISDSNTNVVVDKVTEYLNDNYQGMKPYVVKGLARRKFCDLNRFSANAYDDEEAKEYYDAYHNAIKDFIKDMKDKFPNKLPLLLDIHGQSAKLDSVLRGTANGKTYPFLLNKYGVDGIIGNESLLHYLGSNGIPIYPDCSVPLESSTELQGYTGGFTVCYYSGHHSTYKFDNPIDSIQLEIGKSYRKPKTNLPKLEEFSLHLSGAINSHLSKYS